MATKFNVDEVFEIAEEIERNAAKLYHKASGKASDPKAKETLKNMAGMEEKHMRIFQDMRKDLRETESQEMTFDPRNEAAMYLRAVGASHGYEGRLSPTQELRGRESTKEILEVALNSENESVVYYYGLKELVPDKDGKDKVDVIIREELSHITTLLGYLKEAESPGKS